jgi:hypothetical protein
MVLSRPPKCLAACWDRCLPHLSKRAIKGAKGAKRSWLALLEAGFLFFRSASKTPADPGRYNSKLTLRPK